MAVVTMDSQGKVVIPKAIRDYLEIQPGDDVSLRVLRDGRLVLEKHAKGLQAPMAGEPERSVIRTDSSVMLRYEPPKG